MVYRYRRVPDTVRRFPWEQKEHSNLDNTKGPYTKMKSKASTKLGQKSGLYPITALVLAKGKWTEHSRITL